MIFRDWIASQPPENWGLDEATIKLVTRHYSLREVCDNMDIFFWDKVDTSRQTYLDMVRLQLANQTMDPMVNRYFEAQLKKTGTSTTSGTDGFSRKHDVSTEGHSTSSGTQDINESIDKTGKNIQTRDLTKSEAKTDNATIGKTTTTGRTEKDTYGQSREGYDGYSETLEKQGSEERKTDYGSTFTSTRNGEIKTSEIRKPTGTKTTTDSHTVDTSTTTTRNGSHTQTRDDLQSDRSAQAAKTAPMSAVNLPRQDVSGTTAYDKVLDGSLGDLDFSYASQYGETDAQRGLTSTVKDQYDGQQDIVVTEGNKTANIDEREETWSSDYQDKTDGTTTFNGFSNANARTGSDTETSKFTGRQDVKTIDGAKTYDKGSHDLTVSGTGSEDVTEGHSIKSDGTDTGTVTDDVTGKDVTTGHNATAGTADDTGSTKGTESGDSTMERTLNGESVSQNRYTGREGLTPHQALAAALQYLADYPNALHWLYSQLDPCFIAVYDI